jgi:uncharacterized protein YkwD
MSLQTAAEQLLLELTNRARLDPNLEAARLGIALNEGLAAGTLSPLAKQPLAMNDQLLNAARAHSQAMIDGDFFAHNNPVTGSTPATRTAAAGYTSPTALGENIVYTASTGPISQTTAIINELHQLLFVDAGVTGRGHRLGILNNDFKEVGNGIKTGAGYDPPGGDHTLFNVVMATEDFGTKNAAVRLLTGVTYNDIVVNDDFYTIGEARANVTVTAGGSTLSNAAGGYSLATGSGVQDVTFSGGGLATAKTVRLSAGTENVKLDVVDGHTIYTSGDIQLISGINRAMAIGIGGVDIIGTTGNDVLIGGRGNNKMWGGNGNDILTGGASGSDILDGGSGNDNLSAGLGNDVLIGGYGTDILNGGAGNDFFKFASALVAAGIDSIVGFVAANDTVQLDNAVFTALGATTGTLAAAKYFEGTAAHDADDRIIYNNANGALIYDSNGNAAGGAVQFATLAAGLAASLTNADFVVI